MKQNCCALTLYGLLAALMLSGCGLDDDSPTPRPRSTRVPLFREPGPPCDYIDWEGPLVNDRITCAEIVYDGVTAPEAAPDLAGLVFAPDGTLYVARTALGEIWAMRDEDGDQFMDEPFPVADGLRLPVALTYDDGALVVLSADAVTRLEPSGGGRFDDHTVLIAGLGGPAGFWPGSIGIGPDDDRLYISLGASCALCDGVDDIQPGQVVSYARDGTDRRVEATGLRNPADFAWHPETGELWVVDSGQVVSRVSKGGPPDELNQVAPGADFGFPPCTGADPSNPVCAETTPPRATFPHQSSPGGIAFYTYEGFSLWQGDLIVALRGSTNTLEPAGYALAVAGFEGAEPDGTLSRITPAARPSAVYASYSLAKLALLGRSFFPYHPADIAIDGQGWIYVSVEEGRIFRFRPRPAAG